MTFEANTQWSSFYAPGQEIAQYLRDVVAKYKLRKYITFSTQVTRAEWNEDAGKWVITLKDAQTGEESRDECDIYLPATGFLNDWKVSHCSIPRSPIQVSQWPDIEGLHSFEGILEHSAGYKSKKEDLAGKRVAGMLSRSIVTGS